MSRATPPPDKQGALVLMALALLFLVGVGVGFALCKGLG